MKNDKITAIKGKNIHGNMMQKWPLKYHILTDLTLSILKDLYAAL